MYTEDLFSVITGHSMIKFLCDVDLLQSVIISGVTGAYFFLSSWHNLQPANTGFVIWKWWFFLNGLLYKSVLEDEIVLVKDVWAKVSVLKFLKYTGNPLLHNNRTEMTSDM